VGGQKKTDPVAERKNPAEKADVFRGTGNGPTRRKGHDQERGLSAYPGLEKCQQKKKKKIKEKK